MFLYTCITVNLLISFQRWQKTPVGNGNWSETPAVWGA